MVARIHLIALLGIGLFYLFTTVSVPEAVMRADLEERQHLAALEDAFATHRNDVALAAELLTAYLDREEPTLALAAVLGGDAALMDHPRVAHGLSEAYEQTGQPQAALATAKLARARCARALGSRRAGTVTPVPLHPCSEALLVALDAHVTALDYMVAWGVVDPARDPRASRAYRIALRKARIATLND